MVLLAIYALSVGFLGCGDRIRVDGGWRYINTSTFHIIYGSLVVCNYHIQGYFEIFFINETRVSDNKKQTMWTLLILFTYVYGRLLNGMCEFDL